MNVFTGLFIPFLGTTLGSAMVFLMKKKMNSKIEKLLLGFASGVMIAASIWSLIIPSIDRDNDGRSICTSLSELLFRIFQKEQLFQCH